MSSALVHIGLYKTGSTYIQDIVGKNSELLLSRGISTIRWAPTDDVRRLNEAVRRGEVAPEQAVWEPVRLIRALDNVAGVKNLFLTSEVLSTLGQYPLSQSNLEHLIRSRYSRVSYLVVIRRIIDQVASGIQERIKCMQMLNYRNIDNQLVSYSLDNRLAAYLGGNYDLTVVDFDQFIKGNTPSQLSSLIAEKLGVEDVSLVDVPAANESIGSEGVAVMLAIGNLIKIAIGKQPPRLVHWPNYRHVRKAILNGIRQNLDTRRKFMPFDENVQKERIAGMRTGNSEFIKAFPGGWCENIFSDQVRPQSLTFLTELPEARKREVRQLILDIWENIAPWIRKDMVVSEDFSPQSAVDYFLKHEKDILL